MPVLIADITDVETSIKKSILDNVVRNVLANTGINNADIINMNESIGQHQPGSTIGKSRDVSFGNTEKVIIEVDEERDELTRIERSPGLDYETPFFHDVENNVKLAPSMVRYNTTVTIRRRAPSKVIVQDWGNEIQRKIDMSREIFETQAEYHYIIPVPCLNLLAECYRTMNYGVTPTITLLEYLKKYFGNHVTVLTTNNGKSKEYAVRATMSRIVGAFSYDGPKEERTDSITSWNAEFTYKFNYTRPEAVTMMYPIAINSTLLPPAWWNATVRPGISEYEASTMNVHVATGTSLVGSSPYIRLPLYLPACDSPKLNIPNYKNGDQALIIGHLEFDRFEITNPMILFNLGNLGDAVLNIIILNYIRLSYNLISTGDDSIIKVLLFENEYPVREDRMHITENLDIVYTGQLDYTKLYRIVIYIETNWWYLENNKFNYLRLSPDFVIAVIKDFYPEISHLIDFEGSDTIPAKALNEIADYIATKNNNLPSGSYGESDAFNKIKTVLNGRIIGHRS